MTGYKIAEAIGRSKSVVYKYLNNGKAVPRWTDREESILTEKYMLGNSPAKIAKRLKRRSPRAVKLKMCRHRKKVRSDSDMSRAAFLLEMAFAAGLSPGKAIQRIRTCDAYAKMKMESDVL